MAHGHKFANPFKIKVRIEQKGGERVSSYAQKKTTLKIIPIYK